VYGGSLVTSVPLSVNVAAQFCSPAVYQSCSQVKACAGYGGLLVTFVPLSANVAAQCCSPAVLQFGEGLFGVPRCIPVTSVQFSVGVAIAAIVQLTEPPQVHVPSVSLSLSFALFLLFSLSLALRKNGAPLSVHANSNYARALHKACA
jgi:hypothetical protein